MIRHSLIFRRQPQVSRRQTPDARRQMYDGFTLIELMVVVIVLGILAATIIPQFMGVTEDAKVNTAKTHIEALKTALGMYNIHMDRFPTTEEGLKALVQPPGDAGKGWKGPYVDELKPDPWGNPYQYRCPGQNGKRYDIWSRGADGADGGEGINADISCWTQTKE
jgi:general secretion pathway protein G